MKISKKLKCWKKD